MTFTIPDGIEPVKPTQYTIPEGISPVGVSRPAVSAASAQPEESFGDQAYSTVKSIGKGILHGMDVFAVTANKAIAGALGRPDIKKQLQVDYEYNTHQYNYDKDTMKHPIAAGVGNFAGGMVATAPLAYLGGAGVGSLFGGALADAGASAAVQGVGRGAGTLLGNMAQGGVMGGLQTEVGQGDKIWNEQGARQGAILGAALTPVQMGASAYLKGAKNYADYSKQLKEIGYKGPIFSTDVPENIGLWNSAKAGLVDRYVSKIPILNNVPGIGVTSARQAQQDAIKDVITQYVSGVADKYPNGTLSTFSKALNNSKDIADETINRASTAFRSILNESNINTHQLNTSMPLIKDLAASGKSVLSANVLKTLRDSSDEITTDALLGSKESAGLKQKIWHEYERLSGDRMNTPAYDAANKLKQLYHSLNDDIETSIQNAPHAVEAFHTFNTVTNGIKTLWDPRNSPDIARAIKSINTNQQGLVSLFNSLVNNKFSKDTTSKYASMIGNEGVGAARDQYVQNIFAKSLNPMTGDFNVTGFFKGLQDTTNSGFNITNQQTVKALSGLQYLAQQNLKATASTPASPSNIANAVVGQIGAIGAIAGSGYLAAGPTTAVLATGAALGTLTAHPVLKQTLAVLDNIGKIENQGIAQYFLRKANNQLIRAGIMAQPGDDGSVTYTQETGE